MGASRIDDVRRHGETGADLPAGAFDEPAAIAPALDLTVVVPYYNPQGRMSAVVDHLATALRDAGARFEIVTVSDGCTDGSHISAVPGAVRCLELAAHRGKGEALRVGLGSGRGRYVGFIDADGDLDPLQLVPWLRAMKGGGPAMIIGSKSHPDSRVECSRVRRTASRWYQRLVAALFQLDVRDTQTGLKLIRRDVLADVLPLTVERGFAFDLELVVLATHRGHGPIVEAPVRIARDGGSTVSFAAACTLIAQTLAVHWRLRMRRMYGAPVCAS